MALARTDIVCEKCGNTFTYRKNVQIERTQIILKNGQWKI